MSQSQFNANSFFPQWSRPFQLERLIRRCSRCPALVMGTRRQGRPGVNRRMELYGAQVMRGQSDRDRAVQVEWASWWSGHRSGHRRMRPLVGA